MRYYLDDLKHVSSCSSGRLFFIGKFKGMWYNIKRNRDTGNGSPRKYQGDRYSVEGLAVVLIVIDQF